MRHEHRVTRTTENRIVRRIVLAVAVCAVAWAAVGGGVSGIVTDAKGTAVSGARVIAVSAAQGIQTKATTDAKGAYRLPVLAVGQYDLKVEAGGFKPMTRKILIHVDDKLRLDIMLESENAQ